MCKSYSFLNVSQLHETNNISFFILQEAKDSTIFFIHCKINGFITLINIAELNISTIKKM